MKRIISLVLLLSLLICLFGCTNPTDNGINAGDTGNDEKENNTTDDGCERIEYTKADDLVAKLYHYMYHYKAGISLADNSLEHKIDAVKSGKQQALYVDFDDSEYYFVVAYSKECNHEHQDVPQCLCAIDYRWVRFDRENEITDTYDDLNFMVAFQFNVANTVSDISSINRDVPDVEHYELYIPDFENGFNKLSALSFNESYIYFHEFDKSEAALHLFNKERYGNDKAYFSLSFRIDAYYFVDRCVNIDDECYYLLSNDDIELELGKYFDFFKDVIINDKYSGTYESGEPYYSDVLKIRDIGNCIEAYINGTL